MASEPIVVGGNYLWQLSAKKDGVTYNLTGATVTLSFYQPSTVTKRQYTATVTDGPGGLAEYQNPTGTFSPDSAGVDVSGDWVRSWKVVKSGVVLESREIRFKVYASTAAKAA